MFCCSLESEVYQCVMSKNFAISIFVSGGSGCLGHGVILLATYASSS